MNKFLLCILITHFCFISCKKSHEFSEWYLAGYEQGALYKEAVNKFSATSDYSRKELAQILEGLGVDSNAISQEEFALCLDGFKDAVDEKKIAYKIPDQQNASVLPTSIKGLFFTDEMNQTLTRNELPQSREGLSAERLFDQTLPAFVTVKVNTKNGKGHGSGFFVAKGGFILTNNHVTEDAESIEIVMENGQKSKATVVASSENPDLALLQSQITNHSILRFADSNKVKTGAKIYILGKPLFADEDVNLNIGIISRKVEVKKVDHFQIDATINHGNSGGPAIDKNGRVVGIPTWGLTQGERMNFIISSNECLTILREHCPDNFIHEAQ